ncbi:hypothetical protein ACPV6E_08350 [Corynebacterium propinquum]|uniref:hypothetical protein n=1 Tax=Corynebacterium propinquum TaxID=43769 RepID=UPI000DB0D1C8|nr:hypothetical protein [Corynebacterium propinquum]MDK4282144.1 hypothetical protein [Corynebacterium propinquum]PZQ25702.1 MAG: hypothetical protein DI558_06725 [Corynebacterium propinquum]
MEDNWLHRFLAWDFRPAHFCLHDVRAGVPAAIAAGIGAIVVSPNHVATAAKALEKYIRENHTGPEVNSGVVANDGVGDSDGAGDIDESAVLTIIAAVGFPTGRHHILVKASESRLAISQGAHRVWACVDTSTTDANAALSDMISLREAVPYPADLGIVVPDYAGLQPSGAESHSGARASAQRRDELVSTCEFAKVDQLVVVPPEHSSAPAATETPAATKLPLATGLLEAAKHLPDRIPIVLDAGAGKAATTEQNGSRHSASLSAASLSESSLAEWLVAESADLVANKKTLEKAETAKPILAVVPVDPEEIRAVSS